MKKWFELAALALSFVGATATAARAELNQIRHELKLDDIRHGRGLITFDPPGSQGTYPGGINDLGEVVGSYTDADGNSSSFIRESGR